MVVAVVVAAVAVEVAPVDDGAIMLALTPLIVEVGVIVFLAGFNEPQYAQIYAAKCIEINHLKQFASLLLQ